MPFPDKLGTTACPCVIAGSKPILFASRAGGGWPMYCHWKNHDFKDAAVLNTLSVVPIRQLLARDSRLGELADLPVDMGAERSAIDAAWQRFEDKDD